MSDFDLRAIGWVMTRDAFAEIVRDALRLRRRVSTEALAEIGKRWTSVSASRVRAPALPGWGRSDAAEAAGAADRDSAVCDFVEDLLTRCPSLYGRDPLRRRYLSALAVAVSGFLLSAISSRFAAFPLFGELALVFFVMGCWNVVTTFQLWRVLPDFASTQTPLHTLKVNFPVLPDETSARCR